MTNTARTEAFILNPVTGEWIAYEVFGTQPTCVIVISPVTGKQVKISRNAVRWERPVR